MNYIGFGKLVEKLIYFSGQKNYTLAKHLGYDVSYISKWISGTMLPSSKHIRVLSENMSKYISENLTDSTKEELISYFDIKESTDEELLRYMQERINEEYSYSYELSNKKSTSKSQKALNGVIGVNPRRRRKVLEEEVLKMIKGNKEDTEIIIMADPLSLDIESKINLAGIRDKNELDEVSDKINLKFLVSFEENVKNVVQDTILFINLVNSYVDKNYELHSCHFTQNCMVAVIKDKLFYNATYIDNDICLYANYSMEKEVVEESYEALVDIINTKSKPTFLQKKSEDMIMDKNYMQYIIGNDLRWLIGSINELFMPSDLFLELGQEVFGNSVEIIEELKKIDAILQNATYNSELKVLMYESGLRRYISTGKLSFFNKQITLDFEQRQRHIEYMEKLFKENDNINIRFINGDLLEELKNNQNPSICLSKSINLLRVSCMEDENEYLIVKNKKLENILSKFFEEVWQLNNGKISRERKDIIKRISDSLNYAKILNGNFSKY